MGALVTGYVFGRVYERQAAIIFAGDLVGTAMQAEQLKLGETAYFLRTLEESIPERVLTIHGNETLRSVESADTELGATKRFHVCTKTEVPESIRTIIDGVPLSENACSPFE